MMTAKKQTVIIVHYYHFRPILSSSAGWFMHKHTHTQQIANQTQQLSKATKELPIISKKNNINIKWSVDKKLKSRSTNKFIDIFPLKLIIVKSLTNQWLKPYPQLMKVGTKKIKQQINNNIDDDDDDNNEIHLSTLMNLNYVVITIRINKKKEVRATHIVFFI